MGVALLHAVRARQPDLAMLRMLGAPPRRVALLVLAEALCLAVLGAVLGLLAGHLAAEGIGQLLAAAPRSVDRAVVQRCRTAGGGPGAHRRGPAAGWPAWRAYRLDVTQLLQAPR